MIIVTIASVVSASKTVINIPSPISVARLSRIYDTRIEGIF